MLPSDMELIFGFKPGVLMEHTGHGQEPDAMVSRAPGSAAAVHWEHVRS